MATAAVSSREEAGDVLNQVSDTSAMSAATAAAPAQSYTILGANHTGITVSDLERSLDFWHRGLQLPLLYTVTLEGAMISEVTGVSDARVAIGQVKLPNGHGIELLQYLDPAQGTHYRPNSNDVGSVHVALDVHGLDAMVEAVKKLEWVRVGKTQTIEGGALDGTRVAYIRGPDGETVELMEPPH